MADKFVELECGRRREEQMIIYATCRDWPHLDHETRAEIRALIADVTDYAALGRALYLLLTTDRSFLSVAMSCHVPERELREARKEFYRRWRL